MVSLDRCSQSQCPNPPVTVAYRDGGQFALCAAHRSPDPLGELHPQMQVNAEKMREGWRTLLRSLVGDLKTAIDDEKRPHRAVEAPEELGYLACQLAVDLSSFRAEVTSRDYPFEQPTMTAIRGLLPDLSLAGAELGLRLALPASIQPRAVDALFESWAARGMGQPLTAITPYLQAWEQPHDLGEFFSVALCFDRLVHEAAPTEYRLALPGLGVVAFLGAATETVNLVNHYSRVPL